MIDNVKGLSVVDEYGTNGTVVKYLDIIKYSDVVKTFFQDPDQDLKFKTKTRPSVQD